MSVITAQIAIDEITFFQINLLGVIKSCTFHSLGFVIGSGTTTICEFGMMSDHVPKNNQYVIKKNYQNTRTD